MFSLFFRFSCLLGKNRIANQADGVYFLVFISSLRAFGIVSFLVGRCGEPSIRIHSSMFSPHNRMAFYYSTFPALLYLTIDGCFCCSYISLLLYEDKWQMKLSNE